MKRFFVSLLLFLVSVQSTFAEFRIWTDKKGNMLEAQLDGVEVDKIVLVSRDGKKLLLSPLSLCDGDQEYLKGKIPDDMFDPTKSALDLEKPPRLEFEFKKLTDTKNNISSSSYRDIDMVSSVKIIKKNREPYTGKLKAVMYVIGYHDVQNEYAMLDIKEHEFTFSSDREVTITGDHITLREYKYNSNESTEYEGYLVVVYDEKGAVLTVDSSSKKFAADYLSLIEQKKGDYFSKQYNKKRNNGGGVYY